MAPEIDQGARPTHADSPRPTGIGSVRMTIEMIRPRMNSIFLLAIVG
jgi:hypothetical protein